jgi:hypothetical protein
VTWEDLPMKRELFDKLRNGRHVFLEDGEAFRTLSENENLFREFFGSLGFTLVRHSRDFFYFEGTGGGSSKAAVFFFILVEWISDEGRGIAESLFEEPIPVEKLPHLTRDRYRKYLLETGIDCEDDLMNLLKRMEKLGFIHFEDEGAFVFKAPAYRFLDLCNEIKSEGTGEENA